MKKALVILCTIFMIVSLSSGQMAHLGRSNSYWTQEYGFQPTGWSDYYDYQPEYYPTMYWQAYGPVYGQHDSYYGYDLNKANYNNQGMGQWWNYNPSYGWVSGWGYL
jgi:hypothetical protein